MVKIEVPEAPEATEPIGQENEIKVEYVSNNSKRKSSEGEESNENPSSNKKIKITDEDIEQMKGMTPEQKRYVEGLLAQIDEVTTKWKTSEKKLHDIHLAVCPRSIQKWCWMWLWQWEGGMEFEEKVKISQMWDFLANKLFWFKP